MSKKLKLKIFWTNVKRVIMSILFINLGFINKVFASENSPFSNVIIDQGPTCYATGPQPVYTIKDVFILLVPVVIVVGLIIGGIVYLIKKHKNKSKKEENNDKQD